VFGRRLPPGARFATGAELFSMRPDDQERTELWNPGAALGWSPIVRLLATPPRYGEASLHAAPSGMVVVVRSVPTC
jgi:hypothetical protein